MDTSVVCDDSDSEVFEVGVSTPAATDDHPAGVINTATTSVARMTSSSSSSCCDDGHSKTSSHASPEPTLLDGGSHSSSGHHVHHGHMHHHHPHHHTVSGPTVEWRPMKSAGEVDNGGSSSGMMLRNSRVAGKTSTNDDLHVQSPQDHNNIHDYGGIVTVMIDPPSDNRQLYAESAAAAVDLGSKLVFRCPSASDEESIDLFADLDDSDSEGEEAEGGTALMKTCLLSR